jgi:predicted AAA+ superfamily ATPase
MESMMSVFKEREVADFIFSDEWLGNTMLFIAGPRQCGKTFLARKFLKEKGCSPLYYNWDIEKVRIRYRKDPDFFVKEASRLRIKKPYVVLDEIHKISRWKNILKGIYDEYQHLISIIVTGSARLDLFRRSGDSLVGRYTMAHLFPFSLREWAGNINDMPSSWLYEDGDWKNMAKTLDVKLAESPPVSKELAELYRRFGPFPAPLISGSEKRSRKWHRDYITLLVREDLRDLSGIRELDRVSHLVELLPGRVGSLLSLRSLGEDLGANHSTVKNWLEALQKLYLIWPIRPYTGKLHRTLRKEPKWYFLDWTFAGNESSRFENLIASALYRFVISLNDRGWPEVKLHFVRTYDKKEIDFILTLNEKPILAIEAKLSDAKFSPQLRRFRKAMDGKFPILQVVSQPGIFLRKGSREYLVGYDRLLMML